LCEHEAVHVDRAQRVEETAAFDARLERLEAANEEVRREIGKQVQPLPNLGAPAGRCKNRYQIPAAKTVLAGIVIGWFILHHLAQEITAGRLEHNHVVDPPRHAADDAGRGGFGVMRTACK